MFIVCSALLLPEAFAEEEVAETTARCEGVFYRAKRDNVPVYAKPDRTSKVVQKLKIGDEVCYVGEEKDFAILDFRPAEEELVFARVVDLWPPETGEKKVPPGLAGVFYRAKQYINYMFQGGVPEDPLLPYRPLMSAWDAVANPDDESQCETLETESCEVPEAKSE